MKDPGPLLASGRDADIFEYAPGLVLRRSREGHSMVGEARIMEYALSQGFPVPEVDEVSADGLTMVMERIHGVDMVATMSKHPWSIRRHGKTLADLHNRLHTLKAPEWLSHAPVGQGDRLLHLDLHPLNVMVGPDGPVVIDWTGATAGDPAVDVALAWVLMAAGEVPTGRLIGTILSRARAVLVKNFLHGIDRSAAREQLRQVVTWKVADPHLSETEQARMWKLVEAEGDANSET